MHLHYATSHFACYRKFNPIAASAPATAHPTSTLFAAAAPVNTVGPPVVVFVAPAVIVVVVIPLWRTIVSVYVPAEAVTVPVIVEVDIVVGTMYLVSTMLKNKRTGERDTGNHRRCRGSSAGARRGGCTGAGPGCLDTHDAAEVAAHCRVKGCRCRCRHQAHRTRPNIDGCRGEAGIYRGDRNDYNSGCWRYRDRRASRTTRWVEPCWKGKSCCDALRDCYDDRLSGSEREEGKEKKGGGMHLCCILYVRQKRASEYKHDLSEIGIN